MQDNKNELFVTCPSGIEPLLIQELEEMGFTEVRSGFRGVYVHGDLESIYKINYLSRIAGRVLLPLHRFRCLGKEDLYASAQEIDWTQYIPQNKSFAIDANGQHPQLKNTLYAAQVLKDAICDQFREKTGARPDVNPASPDVQLNLLLLKNSAIISFDTSGMPLFKRGYRQQGAGAPIQESLAAALLRLAKYTPSDILVDPCCGSGTFLIEAALIASNTPPGFFRKSWGFFFLPEFDKQRWTQFRQEADKQKRSVPPSQIFGIDISPESIKSCRANLAAAGLESIVKIIHSDFVKATLPTPPTLIMCNPPHGRRIGEVDLLKDLYADLGDFMKQKCAKPARAIIFGGSAELVKSVGLKPKKRQEILAGGQSCIIAQYDLY